MWEKMYIWFLVMYLNSKFTVYKPKQAVPCHSSEVAEAAWMAHHDSIVQDQATQQQLYDILAKLLPLSGCKDCTALQNIHINAFNLFSLQYPLLAPNEWLKQLCLDNSKHLDKVRERLFRLENVNTDLKHETGRNDFFNN